MVVQRWAHAACVLWSHLPLCLWLQVRSVLALRADWSREAVMALPL